MTTTTRHPVGWRRVPARIAAAGALLTALGCAADPSTGASVTTDLPQALLACATPPTFEARLWVSGQDEPCPLDVDVAAGTTSGSCDVTPGIERTLTIDWYAVVDHGGDFELLLAQARGKLDLSEPTASATFEIGEDDVKTNACRDLRGDPADGAEIITVDGREVPPCDVDESCNGADGPCTNLGEVCAAADPFDAAVEPP